MIRSFADPETERIWNRDRSRKFPPDMQQRAMRRLTMLDSALSLDELGDLKGNRRHALKNDRMGNMPLPSTCSGAYASSGRTDTLMTSRSSTITDPDWLENEHAGQLLVSEFLEPEELSVEQLARDLDVAPVRIASVIDGARPIDAELDLRLARYFGMSEGFFLRLQDRFEIVEAKRALAGALDRIVPRAA